MKRDKMNYDKNYIITSFSWEMGYKLVFKMNFFVHF